jgi:hypothetical protein
MTLPKREIVVFAVVMAVAVIGLIQLSHEIANACPDPCSSQVCQCYWSSGSGEQLPDRCYSHNSWWSCKPCVGCAQYCYQYCNAFASFQSCTTGGPEDCDPE